MKQNTQTHTHTTISTVELNRGGLYTESLEVAKKLKDSSLDPELANILFSGDLINVCTDIAHIRCVLCSVY